MYNSLSNEGQYDWHPNNSFSQRMGLDKIISSDKIILLLIMQL